MTRRHHRSNTDLGDAMQQLEAVYSLEENLEIITKSIKNIEEELNSLYSDFQVIEINPLFMVLFFRQIAQ
jgi:hypothetical protein